MKIVLAIIILIFVVEILIFYLSCKKNIPFMMVILKSIFNHRDSLTKICAKMFYPFSNEKSNFCVINSYLEKMGNWYISKSPYSLLHNSIENKRHFPTILNFTKIDRFGETVHPDVIYLEDGFGPNKWKYVMAITRYPAGNDFYENPEFLVSSDGMHWDIPYGAVTPVVSYPSDWLGYNSDPSLLLDNDTICLFYRRTQFNGFSANITINKIFTEDGVHWSSPIRLLSLDTHKKDMAKLMSPKIIKFKDKYVMWYVNHGAIEHCVYKIESKDCLIWSDPEKVSLNQNDDEYPWHIDVIHKEELLYMAISVINIKTRKYLIYKSSSNDRGRKWTKMIKLIEPSYAFEEKGCYRGSLLYKDKYFYLYYTGIDRSYTYSTAVTKIHEDQFHDNE